MRSRMRRAASTSKRWGASSLIRFCVVAPAAASFTISSSRQTAALEHDFKHLVGIVVVDEPEQEPAHALSTLRTERRERAHAAAGLPAWQFHHQRFAHRGGV